jgi:predicted permease
MFVTLRHAFRQLLKAPGFTSTAVATFAICLGANLAIFAVVDAMLLRPLPVADADRLVTITNSYPRAGQARATNSIANYYDRRGAMPAFSSVSIYKETSMVVGAADHAERVAIAMISPDFFATLGVPLSKGRSFTEAEMANGADDVAVITDGFWQRYFNSDPNAVGRTFQNNGVATTVVGVLSAGFHFPSSRAQFYRPMASGPFGRNPWMRHTANGGPMVARLAPGATLAAAQAQMDSFNERQLKDDPIAQIIKDSGYCTTVRPFRDDFVREIRPTLVPLEGGVICLLLIGTVNLANLLLIRASGRVREIAVRKALGAGRWDIARDALAETALLALGGGLLGLLVASWGIHLLRALGTEQLPLGEMIAFNGRVAAAALAISIAVGLVLSLPLIWFNLRSDVARGLQVESFGGTSGRRVRRVRSLFIVAQVGFAFVLLTGAGMLSVSLRRVLQTSSGFRTENVLTGTISLPDERYKENAAHLRFVERLMPAIRGIPGIGQVAISSGAPFTRIVPQGAISVEGLSPKSGEALPLHFLAAATGEYWRIMGIPLMAGRFLRESDERDGAVVCVVDQSFAKRYWPGENAVGRRMSIGLSFDKDHPITVVGVVGDVKLHELTEDAGTGMVYFPYSYVLHPVFSLVVSSSLPAAVVAPALQRAVRQIDPDLLVDDVRPLQERFDDSLVARRSPAVLAGLFAAIALMLAAMGTFGVLSYAVTQRRREIGVRMALGAQPVQIRRQFLSAGIRLVCLGCAVGFVGAWAAGRAMQGILFEVPPLNGTALLATAAMLGAVSVPACFLPARRAANVDPAAVLRAE